MRLGKLVSPLLSRLYPKISIIDLSGNNQNAVNYLTKLAKSINKAIEITYTKEKLSVSQQQRTLCRPHIGNV